MTKKHTTSYKKANEHGFTLIELIIVASILTLIMAFAVTSLQALYQSFDRNNMVQEFLFDTRRAKNTALQEGARIIFDFGADQYSVGIDRPPYDAGGSADETLWIKNYLRSTSISSSDDFIFDSRGMLIDVDGNLTSPIVDLKSNGSTYESFTFYASGFPQDFQ